MYLILQMTRLEGSALAFSLGVLILFHEASEYLTITAFAWHPQSARSRHPGLPSSRALELHTQAPSCSPTIDTILNQVEGILQGKHTIHNKEQILQGIRQRHAQDCAWSMQLLAAEEQQDNIKDPTSTSDKFENVTTLTDNYRIACRSRQPLLNATSIAILRQGAETQWQQGSQNNGGATTTTTSSRFTYQRPGNYEAHVADLGPQVRAIVNDLLVREVYPMIRRHFWNDGNSARLCVYDSLYIRYNATEAKMHQQSSSSSSSHDSNSNDEKDDVAIAGAGQPLHRDLGIVSVNIMLNDPKDDFVGGGTFFENQLRDNSNDNTNQPLKPLGPGYCLAHYSNERHAGAATQSGVRDIMVMFVTAQKDPPPAIVQAALLKQSRNQCVCNDDDHDDNNGGGADDPASRVLHCRLLHQSMAVSANPADGEALQYLANALLDYADHILVAERGGHDQSVQALQCARQALTEAALLVPGDARVCNTLGRTLTRLSQQTGDRRLYDKVDEAYKLGIHLLERSRRMGCQVNEELDSMRLNYGLHLANLDLFSQARGVLEPVASQYQPEQQSQSRIYRDAYRLCELCSEREM